MMVLAIGCLGAGAAQTFAYNSAKHSETFTGATLFAAEGSAPEGADTKAVSVAAVPRSSTWTKAFDFYNEGITEHNFQAYTYDFTVANNTNDEVLGNEILSSFKSLKNAGEGALYHHERYDGGGYPEGKAGEDIPLIARMICVADSFDAMNSNRVYRKKLGREKIISEITENKGTQFDPKIADIMLELIEDNRIIADSPE